MALSLTQTSLHLRLFADQLLQTEVCEGQLVLDVVVFVLLWHALFVTDSRVAGIFERIPKLCESLVILHNLLVLIGVFEELAVSLVLLLTVSSVTAFRYISINSGNIKSWSCIWLGLLLVDKFPHLRTINRRPITIEL